MLYDIRDIIIYLVYIDHRRYGHQIIKLKKRNCDKPQNL